MIRACLLAALVPGCNVEDAPEELDALVVFGFVHFDGDDQASQTATAMRPLADAHAAELLEGYRVDSLTTDDLVDAGVTEAADESEIVGMAGRVEMVSTLDDVTWAWTQPDLSQVLDFTKEFRIDAEDGDRECFRSRACPTYAYDAWRINDMAIFGDAESTFRREFRWVDVDGAQVLAMRDLAPQPSDISSGLVRIDQQYSYTLMYEHGGGTERIDAFWTEAYAVGLELPDYFALDFAIKSMNDTAEAIDAYIAENRD